VQLLPFFLAQRYHDRSPDAAALFVHYCPASTGGDVGAVGEDVGNTVPYQQRANQDVMDEGDLWVVWVDSKIEVLYIPYTF
jgi:hypothetical protein